MSKPFGDACAAQLRSSGGQHLYVDWMSTVSPSDGSAFIYVSQCDTDRSTLNFRILSGTILVRTRARPKQTNKATALLFMYKERMHAMRMNEYAWMTEREQHKRNERWWWWWCWCNITIAAYTQYIETVLMNLWSTWLRYVPLVSDALALFCSWSIIGKDFLRDHTIFSTTMTYRGTPAIWLTGLVLHTQFHQGMVSRPHSRTLSLFQWNSLFRRTQINHVIDI
jgi:hypothetical protein